jgi:nitrate reductase NapAB chaperone NapD
MHFSSILVTSAPTSYSRCVDNLESLPGVEVHFRYPDRGRIVVTQETATREEQEEGLRTIQSLSEVLVAEFVYRYHTADLTLTE